ncbi:MAG: hypothetical protein ABSD20_08820 [Terriglobales bacterium]
MITSAVYLFCTGILAAAGRMALAAGAPLLNGFETMGPLIFFLAATALTASAVALIRLHRWSRWAALIYAAWMLAGSIPGVSAAVAGMRAGPLVRGGSIIIGSIVAIRYLSTEAVRDVFQK